jgi:hypothetical protein
MKYPNHRIPVSSNMSIILYTLRIVPFINQTNKTPIFSISGKTEEIMKQLKARCGIVTQLPTIPKTLIFDAYLLCQCI